MKTSTGPSSISRSLSPTGNPTTRLRPTPSRRPSSRRHPVPEKSRWADVSLAGVEFRADDDANDGRDALIEIAAHWTSESNGRTDSSGVSGTVEGALRSLGLTKARLVEVSPGEAFAHMAWAGASGGAHGRRRGAATGRFAAWWAAGALADLSHDWPLSAGELEVAVNEMRWYLWDEGAEPDRLVASLGRRGPRRGTGLGARSVRRGLSRRGRVRCSRSRRPGWGRASRGPLGTCPTSGSASSGRRRSGS